MANVTRQAAPADKHPLALTRDRTALLIIDVQEKFRPVIPEMDAIVENVVRLTLTFQMYRMPILVTEQYPQGLGQTVEVLRALFGVMDVVDKMEFSCVRNDEFLRRFKQLKVDTVVVCGIESHVCVNQTVLDLLQLGMAVHVVADAMGSRNREDHALAERKMLQAGAVPASTEMVLFELTERAGTESFRNIQRMVKHRLRRAPSDGEAPAQAEMSPAAAAAEPPAPVQDLPTSADQVAQPEPSEPPQVSGAADQADTAALIEAPETGVAAEAGSAPSSAAPSEAADKLAESVDTLVKEASEIDALLGDLQKMTDGEPSQASAGGEPDLAAIEKLLGETGSSTESS